MTTDWNVFIEGPPHGKSQPAEVLKYLARYMTGGPISDRRLISDEDGVIQFWARSKDKASGRKSEPYALPGAEFVRRWTMHIVPKGFTVSRSYGGYHNTKRAAYLEGCRQLLGIQEDTPASQEIRPNDRSTSQDAHLADATLSNDVSIGGTSVRQEVPPEAAESSNPKCPHCQIAMQCIRQQSRPSWKQVFERGIYAERSLYSPMFHIWQSVPAAYPIDEYG